MTMWYSDKDVRYVEEQAVRRRTQAAQSSFGSAYEYMAQLGVRAFGEVPIEIADQACDVNEQERIWRLIF